MNLANQLTMARILMALAMFPALMHPSRAGHLAALALFTAGTSRTQTEPPGNCVLRVGRSGAERVLELAVRPVPHGDRQGEPAAVGVVRDVTERERTDELRRRFVADVSHELRTPIASIRAATASRAGPVKCNPRAARRRRVRTPASSGLEKNSGPRQSSRNWITTE